MLRRKRGGSTANGDPLSPHAIEGSIGAAALKRGKYASWELATVVAYHTETHSADVKTLTGRLLRDIAQLRSGVGDSEMLEIGTQVVVSWDLGFMPLILGIVTPSGAPSVLSKDTSITGVSGYGDDNPLQTPKSDSNYRPEQAPSDLMPGDWAKIGTEGHGVAVLKGGTSQIGSPVAMLRSFGINGLLQLIGRRLQMVTDFGVLNFLSNSGRTSLTLRAGTNTQTETGFGEENWTIRFDLGAEGNLLNLELTTPDGQTLFSFVVDADGHFKIYGKGGSDISSGTAKHTQDIEGDLELTVQQTATTEIQGDAKNSYRANLLENIGQDHQFVVGNKSETLVNKDVTYDVGGNMTETIAGGSAKDAKIGNKAKTTSLVNGGWDIDIGNPKKGASATAKPGFSIKTHTGDMSLDSGGKVNIKAKQKAILDSNTKVQLGRGGHPLPLFDTFLKELGTFLTTLISVLQAGTTGSPVAQQLTALGGVQAQLQQFIQKVNTGTPYTSKKLENE